MPSVTFYFEFTGNTSNSIIYYKETEPNTFLQSK